MRNNVILCYFADCIFNERTVQAQCYPEPNYERSESGGCQVEAVNTEMLYIRKLWEVNRESMEG